MQVYAKAKRASTIIGLLDCAGRVIEAQNNSINPLLCTRFARPQGGGALAAAPQKEARREGDGKQGERTHLLHRLAETLVDHG